MPIRWPPWNHFGSPSINIKTLTFFTATSNEWILDPIVYVPRVCIREVPQTCQVSKYFILEYHKVRVMKSQTKWYVFTLMLIKIHLFGGVLSSIWFGYQPHTTYIYCKYHIQFLRAFPMENWHGAWTLHTMYKLKWE